MRGVGLLALALLGRKTPLVWESPTLRLRIVMNYFDTKQYLASLGEQTYARPRIIAIARVSSNIFQKYGRKI